MIAGSAPVKILYVEDDERDLMLAEKYLEESEFLQCEVVHAKNLGSAISHINGSNDIDLVLLDLNLPDSTGVSTYKSMAKSCPNLPVVVLTGLDDNSLIRDLAMCGAQDCLLKGRVDVNRLEMSVLFALKRQNMLNSRSRLVGFDELTGLLNRNGFMDQATKQLELANRENRRAFMILLDVDNLKSVNDKFGHGAGDELLVSIARIIRDVFREVDILGRVGGDEFAIFAIEELSAHYGKVLERFNKAFDAHNDSGLNPVRMSVSCGLAYSHPEKRVDLGDMITLAENILIEQKAIKGL